jgi:integrase
MSDANDKMFEEFWNSKYAMRENKDLASARHDFIRAIRVIDPLPLLTTNPRVLDQKLIEKCGRETPKRKRVASKLNEILDYHKIKGSLVICRTPREPVKHLTKDEMMTLAMCAELEAIRLGIITLFATGCRVGEALDLGSGRIDQKRGTIYVESQISLLTKDREMPKRGSEGEVFVIPEFWQDVMRWIRLKDKSRETYEELYAFITKKSRSLWPEDALKHVSPHDLRHSHAIHLLESGASIEIVARNLRNSITTCQKHYTGYQHSAGTVEMLKNIFKGPREMAETPQLHGQEELAER